MRPVDLMWFPDTKFIGRAAVPFGSENYFCPYREEQKSQSPKASYKPQRPANDSDAAESVEKEKRHVS